MTARGALVRSAPWNGPFAAFEDADLVVVRSTWDYHEAIDAFDHWLDQLDAAAIPTVNQTSLLRWNSRKAYLLDLQDNGAPTIPTVAVQPDAAAVFATAHARNWERCVLKCMVSATAHGMSVLNPQDCDAIAMALEVARPWSAGGLMLQPFLPEILTAGELSMVYLGGDFSHAVRKTAQPGEYRVQDDYGGSYAPATPTAAVRATAERVLALAPVSAQAPTYARIDGVLRDGEFLLMELELTEPDLMFDHAPEAAERFADVIIAQL